MYLILYYITRYNIYHIFLPISNAQFCNRLISLNARQTTTTQTINYAQNYFPDSRPYIEWWSMMTRKKNCCYTKRLLPLPKKYILSKHNPCRSPPKSYPLFVLFNKIRLTAAEWYVMKVIYQFQFNINRNWCCITIPFHR